MQTLTDRTVPLHELEALVRRWRIFAQAGRNYGGPNDPRALAFHECATMLSDLIALEG